MDLNQLTHADIVLTTYDVLKEDLSHDSDRHDGDRRCMRFQKRFLRPSVLLLLLMSFMIFVQIGNIISFRTVLTTKLSDL